MKCKDKEVALSNKEMQILLMLVKAGGKLVASEVISSRAWEVEAYSTNENVWVFISFLRKKLSSIKSKVNIKSIRYQGYYLEYKNA